MRHEAVCERCGLVVSERELDTGPTSVGRKHLRGGRVEWAREPTTAFRVDGGLRTRIGRRTDGYGNVLSSEKTRQLRRLRRQHRRLVGRNDRVTEALRDVDGIGANLGIPEYVRVDAARLVHVAKERRLPCGRLSWEALAGGAVVLAARNRLGPDAPTLEAVALYTKATHERTCAAARKIRIDGDQQQLSPGRPQAVEVVLEQAGGGFGPGELLAVARVAQRLLDLADENGIGPGTSRVTMATVAVDRATLLLGERPFSRAELVEAATRVVDTSESRVSGYSVELNRALESRGSGGMGRLSTRLEATLGESDGHEVALGRGH
jgi:transcription initiation factor TFIIB